MQKLILVIAILLFSFSGFTQPNFDQTLTDISKQLSGKISKTGNERVAVLNFKDLRGNVTELGRYLAEALSVELTNTPIGVIDRSLTDTISEEIVRMQYGEVAGNAKAEDTMLLAKIDYFIIGTTTLLDNSISVTIKVLDFRKGVLAAGIKSQLPRTDAINNLLRSTINKNYGSGDPANLNTGRKIDTYNKSPLDDLFEARASDLRKGECVKPYFKETCFSGQLCFENQTGEDLIFYCEDFNPGVVRLDEYKMTLPHGTRNCSRLVVVNFDNLTQQFNEATSRQTSFVFSSMDGTKRCRQSFTIDRCVVKSFVLTDKNIVLLKN